jgi:hypothetical protein
VLSLQASKVVAGVIVFQLVSVTATLYLPTINDVPNHRKRSRPAEAGLDR